MNKLQTKKIQFREKGNPLFKEAADFASRGVLEQQKGNYDQAKELIQNGINKLREITISGKSEEREKAMNYYSLFQEFLTNCATQQENEKSAKENSITQALLMKEKLFTTGTSNNFQSLLKEFSNINKANPDEIFDFTAKIFQFFSKANDRGFFWTKDIFIRSEIFRQGNAKISCIYQKNDVYKSINDRISNLNILVKNGVIKEENVEVFINYLIDVQNIFSKELKYISPCGYIKNPNNEAERNKTISLAQKFQNDKNKISSNVREEKISMVKDYIINFVNVCNNFKELKNVLEPKDSYKNEFKQKLNNKKKEICNIFYNTIIKWFIKDTLELSSRFLKKQIMIFETYNVSV